MIAGRKRSATDASQRTTQTSEPQITRIKQMK